VFVAPRIILPPVTIAPPTPVDTVRYTKSRAPFAAPTVPSPIAAITVSRSRKTFGPPSLRSTSAAIGTSLNPAMFWVTRMTPVL